MTAVVIAGGGWAGCAAAVAARKQGADVTLIERTDLLLGLGNAGGIMRNNGRFTATEENIAMGASELFELTDRFALHKDISFPGHAHASFYDVTGLEPKVSELLRNMGVRLVMETRLVDVSKTCGISGQSILSALIAADGQIFEGDVFIDCTGTTGPMGNCMEYGHGCSMCVLRCPSYGPRVSISAKAGGHDYFGLREDGTPGAFSGSCKLDKGSLSTELQSQLNDMGVAAVPLPEELISQKKLMAKVCRQYALADFAENIILIDTGAAKMMTSYFPIEELRKVPGFEQSRYLEPMAGGKGNSVRFLAMTERDEYLKVRGTENLFCAGEKSGPYVGHTEAITTGSLAGYNAAAGFDRNGKKRLLRLPAATAVGALLNFPMPEKGMLTFAGDVFFDYMKKTGLYTCNREKIRERVKAAGLLDVYC